MLDHTKTCAPIYSDEEREVFSTAANPNVDTAKLIHFAIGLFWKASAHSWRSKESEPAIALGHTKRRYACTFWVKLNCQQMSRW